MDEQPTSGRRIIRFTFACQRCSSVLEARSDLAGQSGRCPTCGAVFVIPEVDLRTGVAVGPAQVADDGQLPTPMHAYATAGARAPEIRRLATDEQVIICPRCHKQTPVESDVCPACGLPFTLEGSLQIQRAAAPSQNGPAQASLILGILSVFTFCLPVLAPVAIGVGIAGLSRSRQTGAGGRTALAGILCGAAGLAMWAAFLLSR